MTAVSMVDEVRNRIVGAVLREVREDALLTQTAAAEWLGVGSTTVSQWETGDRTVSVDRLLELARAYAVPADVLMSVIEKRCQQ